MEMDSLGLDQNLTKRIKSRDLFTGINKLGLTPTEDLALGHWKHHCQICTYHVPLCHVRDRATTRFRKNSLWLFPPLEFPTLKWRPIHFRFHHSSRHYIFSVTFFRHRESILRDTLYCRASLLWQQNYDTCEFRVNLIYTSFSFQACSSRSFPLVFVVHNIMWPCNFP